MLLFSEVHSMFQDRCQTAACRESAYREMRALELEVLVRIQELDRSRQQTSLVLEKDDLILVRMSSFYGVELEEWPSTIAKTAMFPVQHQANQDLALKAGISPDMLPLTESATIVTGDAFQTDWNVVLPGSNNVVIMSTTRRSWDRSVPPSSRRRISSGWGLGTVPSIDASQRARSDVIYSCRSPLTVDVREDGTGVWVVDDVRTVGSGRP